MEEEDRINLEEAVLSKYGYKKSAVFEDDFKKTVEKFSDKFEYITIAATEYFKEGIHGFILIKSSLRTTKKKFDYGSAHARIDGNIIEIYGYLNDMECILNTIR